MPLLLFVSAFALVPVAWLIATSVGPNGAAGIAGVIADPLNAAAVRNSIVQGGVSAVAAILIGYPAGVYLGRSAGRWRPAILAALLVPFLLPVISMVNGIEFLFGPSGWLSGALPTTAVLGAGFGGIVAVNVLYNAPIVVLLTAVGVESASIPMETEVALLGGGAWRRFRDVWGGPSLLGVAGGGLVTFVFSGLAFAAPLLLCGARCFTVEARIWSLDQQYADPTAAALLGVVLLAVFVVPATVYLLTTYRLRRDSGSAVDAERLAPWPRSVGAALFGWTAAVVVAELSVVGVVVAKSFWPGPGSSPALTPWSELFSPSTSAKVGRPTTAALGNSIAFAGMAAGIALLLGIAAGYWVRRRAPGGLGLRLLLVAPLVVSPVLLAFSLQMFWGSLLGGASQVWLLIVLSQATIALPFAVPTLLLSLAPVPSDAREAAQLLGRSPFAAFLEAELPLAKGGVLAATLLAFVVGLGEFTATFFLATPAFTTLPVELYHLDSLRLFAPASACAALLALVSVVAVLALATGGRRVGF